MNKYKFFNVRSEKFFEFFSNFVQDPAFDKYEGRDLTVTITEHRPSRTRKQENYYRKCCHLVARESGDYSADDIHEIILGMTWGTHVETILGQQKRIPVRRSADSKNPKEYAELTETLAHLASEYLGYVLPTPEELEQYGS